GALQHDGDAVDRGAYQDGEAADVEERQDGQPTVVDVAAQVHRRADRAPPQVAVGEQRALRLSGGAGGVDDHEGVGEVDGVAQGDAGAGLRVEVADVDDAERRCGA